MRFIMITNDPDLAIAAEAAGVGRIMVDLELLGKAERQRAWNTHITSHHKEDIAVIRAALHDAELMVRINPWHSGSSEEVDYAVEAGADLLMLPMISSVEQVERFSQVIGGRCGAVALVETGASMAAIEDITDTPGITEIYIGLNDLAISLGLSFLFEPLADGLVDRMAERPRARGIPFGFGGISMLGSGRVPSERILGEHARLGSNRLILSRAFHEAVGLSLPDGRGQRLMEAVKALRRHLQAMSKRPPEQIEQDRAATNNDIRDTARELRAAGEEKDRPEIT